MRIPRFFIVLSVIQYGKLARIALLKPNIFYFKMENQPEAKLGTELETSKASDKILEILMELEAIEEPASEAEKTFWKCPELVTKLLLVLDLKSLALLLEAHKPLIDILTEGTSTWNKLTRRTVSGWDKENDYKLRQTRNGCEEGDADRWALFPNQDQLEHIKVQVLDLVTRVSILRYFL